MAKFYNKILHKIVFLSIIMITCLVNITFALADNNTSATLLAGTSLSAKMKTIANGGVSATANSNNYNVKSIKKATTKKAGLTSANIISAENSENEVYMWFENDTLYYYSDADTIYMNADSSYAFRTLVNLTDISGLEYLDTSRVTNMGRLFLDCTNLTDLSPLTNWDTSNVTNMYFTFGANYTGSSGTPMKLSDLSPLANWDTSSVTTMNSMFKGCTSLKTLDALKDWNVSNVTDMQQMFNRTGLTDASGIEGWNISSVTNFNMMLANIPSTTPKPNFTYRSGRWSSNGTFTSNPNISITITKVWNDEDSSTRPDNIKIYLRKEGASTDQVSTDSNWTKNNNGTWTYVFSVYDSATYYVWEEDLDSYTSDAPQSSPKKITNNSATITNTIKKHDITLTDIVTGNMASLDDEFEYKFTIYDRNDNLVSGNITLNSSETVTLSNGSFTKKITNGQNIVVNSLPHGYKYKISATDTDYNESYTLTTASGTTLTKANTDTDVFIVNGNQTLTFTNIKDTPVPTGISINIVPFVIVFTLGIIYFISTRYLSKKYGYHV